MNNIKLSVALVTRNRPEILETCLTSWRNQPVQPFEIVVSDDSSEAFASLIKSIAAKYNCVYVKGPQRGLYANRNTAALACSGTHIVTGDDDHTHPDNYVSTIMECLSKDPNRIWVFGEKLPYDPTMPLICPAEMQADGVVRSSTTPDDCAAIGDGSTVYPRTIFDSGLRYDETYFFGGLWYLWGATLKKNGWRMSFCDRSFVWHNAEMDQRRDDPIWLKKQLECNLYVSTYFAFYLNPNIKSISRALYSIVKKVVLKTGYFNYNIRVRVPFSAIGRIIKNAHNTHIRAKTLEQKIPKL